MLHQNTTVIRRVTTVRTERGVRLTVCQGDVPSVGAVTKIIKLTRLELFYEEKLWIYTYDSQENSITITQIQLVLVAAS